MNEPEDRPREDGTIRRAHYGAGKQPWDTIVEQGWGPAFAVSNVLKYLRRTKDREHSLESARWYWLQILEHCTLTVEEVQKQYWARSTQESIGWELALYRLMKLLTPEERELLG